MTEIGSQIASSESKAPKLPEATVPIKGGVNEARAHPLRRLLRRYEAVVGTIAVIVVLTRVAGGSFISPATSSPIGAPTPQVAPFEQPPQQSGSLQSSSPRGNSVSAPISSNLPGTTSGNPTSIGPSLSQGSTPSAPAAGAAPTPAANVTQEPTPAPQSQSPAVTAVLSSVPAPGAPSGVAVARDGSIWVTTDNGSRGGSGPARVFHFGSRGDLLGSYAVPGVEGGITSLAIGHDGTLYLASRSPAAVIKFNPSSGQSQIYSQIPDVPPCLGPILSTNCDGSVTGASPLPMAVAFSQTGQLFVADAGQGAIWTVPPGGGTAKEWTVQSSWTNPTHAAGPTGLAFDGAGNLVISVSSQLTQDVGAIYLAVLQSDGSAGTISQLAQTGQASRPAGLTLSRSGRIYVTLSGTGRVLILQPNGATAGDLLGPAGAQIDTPVGIAFSGNEILVSAQTPGNPNGGQLISIPVADSGGDIYTR